MKQEITYQATDDALSSIRNWQNWLRNERRYSIHTRDAYFRDLSHFFAFLSEQKHKKISLKDLNKIDIRDFRSYISFRSGKHCDRSTLARNISCLRNFFHWLDDNDIVKNHAIGIISTPKQAKHLPKALDADDALEVLSHCKQSNKTRRTNDIRQCKAHFPKKN